MATQLSFIAPVSCTASEIKHQAPLAWAPDAQRLHQPRQPGSMAPPWRLPDPFCPERHVSTLLSDVGCTSPPTTAISSHGSSPGLLSSTCGGPSGSDSSPGPSRARGTMQAQCLAQCVLVEWTNAESWQPRKRTEKSQVLRPAQAVHNGLSQIHLATWNFLTYLRFYCASEGQCITNQ